MTGLVEIPASWYLDDLPPMMFIKKVRRSRCIRDHRYVYILTTSTLSHQTVTDG